MVGTDEIADTENAEAQERSIDSWDNGSGHSNMSAMDDLIGLQISAQIESLKQHQENAQTQQMLNAAYCNDIKKIKSLQSRYVNLNATDGLGRTALYVAASQGHLHTVEYLLTNKADASMKDIHANTPLNDAVRNKHDAVAAYIRNVSNTKVFLRFCMMIGAFIIPNEIVS